MTNTNAKTHRILLASYVVPTYDFMYKNECSMRPSDRQSIRNASHTKPRKPTVYNLCSMLSLEIGNG